MYSNQSDIELIEKFLTTSVNIFLYVQHFSLLLKFEGVMAMNYKQVFWAYWILLIIGSGIVVLLVIFMASNSYLLCTMIINRRCPEKQVRYYFSLVFIVSLTLGSFIYISTALLVNLYQYLDSNRKSQYDPLFNYIAIGWMVVMTISIKLLLSCLTLNN
jgi:hypothetical protein